MGDLLRPPGHRAFHCSLIHPRAGVGVARWDLRSHKTSGTYGSIWMATGVDLRRQRSVHMGDRAWCPLRAAPSLTDRAPALSPADIMPS
jgi:hypothetical protein